MRCDDAEVVHRSEPNAIHTELGMMRRPKTQQIIMNFGLSAFLYDALENSIATLTSDGRPHTHGECLIRATRSRESDFRNAFLAAANVN